MSSNPRFSVVTPSYNQAEFIGETIESVSRQTYDNVEHIVIDGESDDGTQSVLKENDNDLRWISEPDDGQYDAINKGFDMSEGEIIGWLNADDVYFDTGVFERVAEYFDRSDADLIYGDIALIDSMSQVMKFQVVPKFDFDRLVRGCFIEQPALFFRRKVVKKFKLTNLRNGMDYEYWLRIADQSDYTFQNVRDVLACDRNHPDRKMLAEAENIKASAMELQREYGLSSGTSYWVDRTTDILLSGIPRRVYALGLAVLYSVDQPDLAFDGKFHPLPVLVKNTFRPNHELVN